MDSPIRWTIMAFYLGFVPLFAAGQDPSAGSIILEKKGSVHYASREGQWIEAAKGQGLRDYDRIRTGQSSTATVRLENGSVLRLAQLTTIDILPARKEATSTTLSVLQGLLYFFSREEPEEIEILTPSATGAIKGTEFDVRVAADGTTDLTVVEGAVTLSNARGSVALLSGEAGRVAPGSTPDKTVVINAFNRVQWALYYPAVLDVDELRLNQKETAALASSLVRYRQGDLAGSFTELNETGIELESDDARSLSQNLRLTMGQLEEVAAELKTALRPTGSTRALRILIAAVAGDGGMAISEPRSASEWLALSYLKQSRSDLVGALAAARTAVEVSSEFGHAWVRIGELEFSFGRLDTAVSALDRGARLSPHNPQGHALKGFFAAAGGDAQAARDAFKMTIGEDGNLANGWLGTGLLDFRERHAAAGLENLKAAVAMEPTRSLLRSYLAKGQAEVLAYEEARDELEIATRLDPSDPTPEFYDALINQKLNRYNAAVSALEKSIALNDNRHVYRSRLLLDEDRAVRNANIAAIYKNLGMRDRSVRASTDAVTSDYTNYSAHLFLANSYDVQRDPRRIQLRLETAWFNELLLANLLAPVNAGSLSQQVSNQEYSSFFAGKQMGFHSETTAYSHGEFRQRGTFYTMGEATSVTVDLSYHTFDGFRENNDFERFETNVKWKQRISDKGAFYFDLGYQDFSGGDLFLVEDPSGGQVNFRFEEEQTPIVLGGYHHRWGPGVDTLILGGRLSDEVKVADVQSPLLVLTLDQSATISSVNALPLDVSYQSDLEIYTFELNQIIQKPGFTAVAGFRLQDGSFDSSNELNNPPEGLGSFFKDPPAADRFIDDFERLSIYGYLFLEPVDNVTVLGGVAYDDITSPLNFRRIPIAGGSTSEDRLSSKFGVTWHAHPDILLRGLYTESMGGVSFDESIRLEPTQLLGFNQSFRTIISNDHFGIPRGSG